MKTQQKYQRSFHALCRWCVYALLCLQLAAAYPVSDPGSKEPCQAVHARPNAIHLNDIPETLAKQLDLIGNNESEVFLLVESSDHKQKRSKEGSVSHTLDNLQKGNGMVCYGKGIFTFPDGNCGKMSHTDLLVVYAFDKINEKELLSARDVHKARPLILLAPTSCQYSSLSVWVSCEQGMEECLDISFGDSNSSGRRLHRRSAVSSHMTSKDESHGIGSDVTTQGVVVSVVVVVIGLIVLVSVVAMCGGSDTYDTVQNVTYKSDDNVPSEPSVTIPVHEEVVQKQNGSVTKEQPSAAEQSSSYKRNSTPERSSLTLPHDPISPVFSTEERKERARTLSARSFDPLPEIPKLELAEDVPASSETKRILNNDDEAAYSYARVPGRNGKEVPESDPSDDEEVDSPEGDKSQSTGLPPYGKVTRNQSLDKVQSGDEYAEVSGEKLIPPPLGKRDRSMTAPVDPVEFGMIRDTRAFTESATHLPLPAIPGGSRPRVDEMYDSIPENLEGKKAKPAIIQPNERKERLYESVDEMGGQEPEDMYESVPEELKVDSPLHVSPMVPTPTSPEGHPFPSLSVVPCPPDSPIPSHRDKHIGSNVKVEKAHGKSKKAERKALEKTMSATDQVEKKRTFSMFGRKKATSVSAGVGKTKKKFDKDVQQLNPHHHDPLPDIPQQASPSHTIPTPRPPSMPAPAPPPAMDDEEDLYDKPQLPIGKERISSESDAVTEHRMTTEEAKTRAKSLPAGMRSAGASVFKFRQDLPLPDVPEDSGQGMVTVTHKRVLEDDTENHTPYDLVVISTPPPDDNQDEPSYDTVRLEDILDPSSEVRNEADPGYDKVGKHLLENGEEGERSAGVEDHEETLENMQSDSPTGQEGATVLGYGKVTRLSSPEGDNVSSGLLRPEHDEIGYAVIPEMIKMRKRALSASQVKKQKLTNQDARAIPAIVSHSSEATPRVESPQREASPSSPQGEHYAVVDIAAKRKQRARENNEQQGPLSPTGRESGGASPIPPPLPPVGDLGDLSEFAEPPLPQRSEATDHLIIKTEDESGYSRVLKVPRDGNLEPPYAKVKSKNDHPYAELDIGGGADGQPEVVVAEEEVRYETPDALIISPVNEMSSGYDTIGDLDKTDSKVPTLNGALPKLETMDFDETHMYDSLGPVSSSGNGQVMLSSPETEADVPTDMYDTLQAQAHDDNIEEPYEEIDEETRLNLQQMHQR